MSQSPQTRRVLLGGALLLCLLVPAARAQQAPRPSGPAVTGADATRKPVDAGVPEDPTVSGVIAPYAAKVAALRNPVGRLDGELKKEGVGAGTLGNFVTDAMRAYAQRKLGRLDLIAVTNAGGLRKNSIAAGPLSAMDIYELLPFENALVAVELTGEQLTRFLGLILAEGDAQSGARIAYRTTADKRRELESVALGYSDGEVAVQGTIDPSATYTVITIDYLVKRGGDYAILQESKAVRPLGVTLRDAVLDYVRGEQAQGRPIRARLDGRFQQAGADAREGGPR